MGHAPVEQAPAALSAVITTYNRAALVGRAVRSALAQTYPPCEVLVVDNASTDATPAVLEELQRADSRVRPVRLTDNTGPSASRNRGLAEARGDLIGFLDDDDAWHPDHLATAARFLADRPDIDLVFAEVQKVDDTGKVLCPAFMAQEKHVHRYLRPDPAAPERFLFAVSESDALLEEYLGNSSTLVVRRAALGEVRYDEAIRCGEDWDFMLRLAQAGRRFGFLNRVLCDVYIHGDNISHEQGSPRIPADMGKIWVKALRQPEVTGAARRRLQERLAGLCVWEGYEHLRGGDRAAARGAFWRSLRSRLSWTAVRGLLVATLMPRRAH